MDNGQPNKRPENTKPSLLISVGRRGIKMLSMNNCVTDVRSLGQCY